jgi:N-acetylmuramoyl-L-alanine amidase
VSTGVVQKLIWDGNVLIKESEEWYNLYDEIIVCLNTIPLTFNVPPIIENNRTLVPFRGVFEVLGATVDWDESTRTVTGALGNTTIKLTIGDTNAYVNGQLVELDVPPKIVNNRTLVPLRFIAENFGFQVDWNGDEQRIDITTQRGAGK